MEANLTQLLELAVQQGIWAVQKADPKAMIWQKLLVNSVINPLTAYYEIKNGALTAAPYRQQAEALLAESVQIANANGAAFTLAEAQDMLWQTVQATAANTSSMCADWLAGRPWELAAINGALLTLAEASHLSVPKQRQLVQALLQKQQERLGR